MLLKGRSVESKVRLGAKLVSQKRKCEGVIEWDRRNRGVASQSSWEWWGRCSKGLKMDMGNLIRRRYLEELLVGWTKVVMVGMERRSYVL